MSVLLKAGMVIKLRNNERYMLHETKSGITGVNNTDGLYKTIISEEMKSEYNLKTLKHKVFEDFDIVAIYESTPYEDQSLLEKNWDHLQQTWGEDITQPKEELELFGDTTNVNTDIIKKSLAILNNASKRSKKIKSELEELFNEI